MKCREKYGARGMVCSNGLLTFLQNGQKPIVDYILLLNVAKIVVGHQVDVKKLTLWIYH